MLIICFIICLLYGNDILFFQSHRTDTTEWLRCTNDRYCKQHNDICKNGIQEYKKSNAPYKKKALLLFLRMIMKY